MVMNMEEHDLDDIYLEKLEDDFNKKELPSILVEQLRKVHKFFTLHFFGVFKPCNGAQ